MAIKQEQGVESLPETPGEQNDSFCSGTFVDSTTFPGGVGDQVSTLLVSSIFEAHQRTCLLTIEQIREQWEVGVEQSKVEDFMRMVGFRPLSVKHSNDSLNISAPRGLVECVCEQTDKCDPANH